jgi:hypothetical protein
MMCCKIPEPGHDRHDHDFPPQALSVRYDVGEIVPIIIPHVPVTAISYSVLIRLRLTRIDDVRDGQ